MNLGRGLRHCAESTYNQPNGMFDAVDLVNIMLMQNQCSKWQRLHIDELWWSPFIGREGEPEQAVTTVD
jgi:hypothetical protein